MKLKLERKLEYINRFCYEARDLKWEMETGNKVLEKLDGHIEIIYPNRFEEKISEGETLIQIALFLQIPLSYTVVSAELYQQTIILNRNFETIAELLPCEIEELAYPLIQLFLSLVLKVAEVVLDESLIQVVWNKLKN